MFAVLHPRKHLLLRCTVAVQLIGGAHPRNVRQPFQPQTAKRLRSMYSSLSNVEGGVHGYEKALKRLASLQAMSPATELTITHNFRELRERPKGEVVDNKKGAVDNKP